MKKITESAKIDGYTPIYRCKMNNDRFGLSEVGARLQDMAEEYAVCEDENANAGLIVYGKYNGVWRPNPWSTRFLIRDLLEKIGVFVSDKQIPDESKKNKKKNKAVRQSLPDWSNAPDWAIYHTIDSDGTKAWYQEKPKIDTDIQGWDNIMGTPYQLYDYCCGPYPDWKNSLKKRPENV